MTDHTSSSNTTDRLTRIRALKGAIGVADAEWLLGEFDKLQMEVKTARDAQERAELPYRQSVAECQKLRTERHQLQNDLTAARLEGERLHKALESVQNLASGHPVECECRQCEIFELLEPIVGNSSPRSTPEPNPTPWRSIETAPRGIDALFWVRAGTCDDGEWYCDTNGNPILSKCEPHLHIGKYGTWSSLMKATAWMPKPNGPTAPPHTTEDDFLHFLSYSNLSCQQAEELLHLRLAYYAGADVTPIESGAPRREAGDRAGPRVSRHTEKSPAEPGESLRTPQGEPALTQTDGLPGTREPVVIAPQGNAGESPALTCDCNSAKWDGAHAGWCASVKSAIVQGADFVLAPKSSDAVGRALYMKEGGREWNELTQLQRAEWTKHARKSSEVCPRCQQSMPGGVALHTDHCPALKSSDALRTDDDPLKPIVQGADFVLAAPSLFTCDECGAALKCGPTEWEYECGHGPAPKSEAVPDGK
jgi:hypothetical protein